MRWSPRPTWRNRVFAHSRATAGAGARANIPSCSSRRDAHPAGLGWSLAPTARPPERVERTAFLGEIRGRAAARSLERGVAGGRRATAPPIILSVWLRRARRCPRTACGSRGLRAAARQERRRARKPAPKILSADAVRRPSECAGYKVRGACNYRRPLQISKCQRRPPADRAPAGKRRERVPLAR